MQIHELCNDTFYGALSMASLKQRALVEIARTLLFSRNHIAQELIGMMRHLVVYYVFPDYVHSPWHKKWRNFRTKISADINRLILPIYFERNVRAAVMCLLRNMCYFPKPEIFNPAMTIQFTSRGDVDVQRTFEDYVEHTLRVPRLPRKKKYELLRDACHLCQERSVQSILCLLLKWRRSALVSSLRNSSRSVEIHREPHYGNWNWKIIFELEDVVDPALWETFVTILNNKYVDSNICFSFEQNVIIASVRQFDLSRGITLVWPKLTTIEKYTHAELCLEVSLAKSDAHLAIRVLRFLDPTRRMQMMEEYCVPIIMCFLRHSYDRHLLPDLILTESNLPRWNFSYHFLFHHITETFLEGNFCRDRREVLAQLWQYIALRNKSFGDALREKIKRNLDSFVRSELFLGVPVSDATEVIFELQKQYSPA